MLAKVTDRRGDGRTSFKSLLAYITRVDGDMSALNPDADVQTNCLSLATAAAEMRAVADRNSRVHDPVYHVVLSWQDGEHPDNAQMFAAGEAALAAIGMQDHQYVFAIHRDTGNAHLHLMVNRVHPETGRAMHPGLSYLKLDRCMRELELAQGWAYDRGAYAVVERGGQPVVERVKRIREAPAMPSAARDMEAHADEQSLFTYASGDPKRDVLALLKRPDVTWQDMHSTLAKHGLELRIKGQGLGVYAKDHNGLTPVKASSLHESLGKGKLEKRFGPYEPPIRAIGLTDADQIYVPTRELPNEDEAPRGDPLQDQRRAEQRAARVRLREDVRARYEAWRDGVLKDMHREGARRRETERAEYQVVLARHQATRAAIRASGLPGLTRKAMYSVSAFERARDLETLKEAQRTRREVRSRPLTYREWIEEQAQRGDEGAISQLHGWYYGKKRGRGPMHRPIEPVRQDRWQGFTTLETGDIDPAAPGRVLKQMRWQVDRETGDVQYYQHDQHVFTDSGRRIAFRAQQPAQDAVLAGLLLARQKFGAPLNVVGEADFREKIVQMAVEHQLDVRFGDPVLEAQRQALEQARQQAGQQTRPQAPMPARTRPVERDEPAPER
jgi:hypothetical protein